MSGWWDRLWKPRGAGPSHLPPPEDRHLPGRPDIESYGEGGFRFSDVSHRGAILCLPSGVFAWEAHSPADLTIAAFERVRREGDAIETLLVGTGETLSWLDPAVLAHLKSMNMVVECMATGSAVRTYNIMLGENRAVACALLPVD